MANAIDRSISLLLQSRKTSWPWKEGEPYQQSHFAFSNGSWGKAKEQARTGQEHRHMITRLALYSWNIDFMLPFSDSRMQAALSELHSVVAARASEQKGEATASVIFLQECVQSDLKVIRDQPWIQNNFFITDLDCEYWASKFYGTTTLIDKRLAVAAAFRVHYPRTRMERDALFVDIETQGRILRLCNTHLESLVSDPPLRPSQMKIASSFMRETSVAAAVLAGDLNAIQDFDGHLHTDNGLKDAYLELSGSETGSQGHTWGQQASTTLRKLYGTSRMDKIFFCGALKLESFETFGADITLEDQAERDEIVQLDFEKPWITDHLGVKAIFEMVADGSQKL